MTYGLKWAAREASLRTDIKRFSEVTERTSYASLCTRNKSCLNTALCCMKSRVYWSATEEIARCHPPRRRLLGLGRTNNSGPRATHLSRCLPGALAKCMRYNLVPSLREYDEQRFAKAFQQTACINAQAQALEARHGRMRSR